MHKNEFQQNSTHTDSKTQYFNSNRCQGMAQRCREYYANIVKSWQHRRFDLIWLVYCLRSFHLWWPLIAVYLLKFQFTWIGYRFGLWRLCCCLSLCFHWSDILMEMLTALNINMYFISIRQRQTEWMHGNEWPVVFTWTDNKFIILPKMWCRAHRFHIITDRNVKMWFGEFYLLSFEWSFWIWSS